MVIRPVLLAVAAGFLAAGCSHHAMGSVSATTSPVSRSSAGPAKSSAPAIRSASTESPKFIWQDVHFAFDDASLNDDAREILSATGAYLLKHPRKVEVQGNCDERGSVEYNLALGERRATTARSFLESYGVPAEEITTISFGKEKPMDPGHDESAWAKNRRDHFVETGSGS